MDKRIRKITLYEITLNKTTAAVFNNLKEAQTLLDLADLVNAAYSIHAKDIKQDSHPVLKNSEFTLDCGRDSTDYVTVRPLYFSREAVLTAKKHMSKLLSMLGMVDNLVITTNSLWFECHDPSER